MSNGSSILIDAGSSVFRIGFSGLEKHNSFQSVIGQSKNSNDIYIGIDALKNGANLDLQYPIKLGLVEDWDNFEKLLNYSFYNKLKLKESFKKGIYMLESAFANKNYREKMIEYLFEKYSIQFYAPVAQGLLSSFACSNLNCLSVDIGEEKIHICPTYDQLIIKSGIQSKQIGGKDITKSLQDSLCKKGYDFSGAYGLELARIVKENYSFVTLDDEPQNYEQTTKIYSIPEKITIGNEIYESNELLFKPTNDFDGLPKMICDSIHKCNRNFQSDLFRHICVTGGVTKTKNFVERPQKELTKLEPEKNIHIYNYPRNDDNWNGLLIYERYKELNYKTKITHDEYDESGPGIINSRNHDFMPDDYMEKKRQR